MNSDLDLRACTACGCIQTLPGSGRHWRCGRCGSALFAGGNRHVRSGVLAFAALVLYVPANVYPVLAMEQFGRRSESTIVEGVADLAGHGMWGIAAIVFVASLLVPLLKILGLFFLCATARLQRWRRLRFNVHRVIEAIGPWSMLDVMLVAILVALVKIGDVANVTAEPGLVAFAAVVVLTMLASASLDGRQIWDEDL